MYSLGNDFIPPEIHAGGLRYHGKTPILSILVNEGLIQARSYSQEEVFKSAMLLYQNENLLVAPETAHAICAVVEEAKRARLESKSKVLVVCITGQGYLDLPSYKKVFKLS